MSSENESRPIVPVEQRTIDFYGDQLVAVRDAEGVVWVPVRRLCEALEVDRQGQMDRISRDPVLRRAMRDVVVCIADSRQYSMACLPMKYIRHLLLGICAGRINPRVRPKLILYQEELIELIDRQMGDSLLPPERVVPGGNDQEVQAQDAGHIYLLRSGDGYFKIGKTKDLSQRFKALATALPFSVEVLHTISVSHMAWAEQHLHQLFARHRMNGEWFNLSPEQVAWIMSLATLEPSGAEEA